MIDSQQPPATNGFLFNDNMRAALREYHARGMTQSQSFGRLAAMAAREIQTSEEARRQYVDFWDASGVDVACGTYAGPGPIGSAFEDAVTSIAQARSIVDALDDRMLLVLEADDIERAQREGKHGLIIDFQNTTPFSDQLDRDRGVPQHGTPHVPADLQHRHAGGGRLHRGRQERPGPISGAPSSRRLNELNIIVDVSHCSEQVGWDAMEVSTSPVIVSHACSSSVCYHDRGKSDEFVKAIADQGGFIGVVTIPGFLQETTEATLDDVAAHVEHLVNVMGIEHVGIGTDKAGPGPGTDSMVEWPEGMVDDRLTARPGEFNFSGFRLEEHRLTDDIPHRRVQRLHGLAEHNGQACRARLRRRGAAPDTGPQLPEGLPRRGGVGGRDYGV